MNPAKSSSGGVRRVQYVRVVGQAEAKRITESGRIEPSSEEWPTSEGQVYSKGSVVFLFKASVAGWQNTARTLYTNPNRCLVLIYRDLETQPDSSAFGWNGSVVHFGPVNLSKDQYCIVEAPTELDFDWILESCEM